MDGIEETPVDSIDVEVDEGSAHAIATHGDLGLAGELIDGVGGLFLGPVAGPGAVVSGTEDDAVELVGGGAVVGIKWGVAE